MSSDARQRGASERDTKLRQARCLFDAQVREACDVRRNLAGALGERAELLVGTGLGLSICQRIVTSFGGDISVESVVGRGTLFRVSLVAAAANQNDRPGHSSLDVVVAPRRGRILVLDDDDMSARSDILARPWSV